MLQLQWPGPLNFPVIRQWSLSFSSSSSMKFSKIQQMLSDCNRTRTNNHLVSKRTLNRLTKLAKRLSYVVSKEVLGIQVTIACGFTLKRACDMIRTDSHMHHTDKYSRHSSIIWPVWPNGWVFVYKIISCEFESRCSHLNFGYSACFKEIASWNSGNYKVWIHTKMHTWHDKNIQSVSKYYLIEIILLIFHTRSNFFITFYNIQTL